MFKGGDRMDAIVQCIKDLQMKLSKYRRSDLKEYPTRTIFIDPLLQALGWDVRNPDEVQLEYTSIDGRFVDYALKINGKPVLFIEAKPLNDPLTDVKAIAQVVGYAANAGVEWCILTNGVTYKVYRSTEKAEAPDKLLFEVSIDPEETENMTMQQIAEKFARFSREAMARGVLDEIGEQIFITRKVRKALDKLFEDPPKVLVNLIHKTIGDNAIKPIQVKEALKRLWSQAPESEVSPTPGLGSADRKKPETRAKEYDEDHHLRGKPQEVVELFKALDKFCRELDPARVQRVYLAKYIKYMHGKNTFCCVCVKKSKLRVWLKLNYSDLENPPEYVRDVSKIGHWGTGDVEIAIDSIQKFQSVKSLIQKSFEENRPK